MKLGAKLTLFSTLTIVAIVALFILMLPRLMEKTAWNHTNSSLISQKYHAMSEIHRNGLEYYFQGEQTYGSYSMLKEEYVSLEPYDSLVPDSFKTLPRIVEGDTITYQILSHTFPYGHKVYLLEVGKEVAGIYDYAYSLQRTASWVLLLLAGIIFISTLLYTRYLLKPMDHIIKNRLLNPKFPFIKKPLPIQTTTTDFKYLDDTILSMMEKINREFQVEREFTSNASHELMTPLSIMQSKIENLLLGGNLTDSQVSKLDELLNSLHRLKRIVNSLLLLSRLDNDQFASDETVRISPLILGVTEELNHRLAERGLSIEVNIDPKKFIDNTNHDLLFQLFYNIIHNAIKYNKPGGSISISDGGDEGYYRVQVADTGIGIEPDQIDRIFERFKKTPGNAIEGHGLGLSIVKSIAGYLGLKLSVESLPGAGSVFTITFPE